MGSRETVRLGCSKSVRDKDSNTETLRIGEANKAGIRQDPDNRRICPATEE